MLRRFDALGLRGREVIRAISVLTMAAVIALLAVYLLGLLVTLIILWEGKK